MRIVSRVYSKSAIVLAITFIIMIHFQLKFLLDVIGESNYIFLHLVSQLSQSNLLKRHFPQPNCLGTFAKSRMSINLRVYCSISLIYWSILKLELYYLDYSCFVEQFEIRKCLCSNIVLFPLAQQIFCIFSWILELASGYLQKVSWDSHVDCIESIYNFSEYLNFYVQYRGT